MKTTDPRTARTDNLVIAIGVLLFFGGAGLFIVSWTIGVPMVVGGGLAMVLGFSYKFFGE